MSLMMRSGLSGPSGIYSKPIKPACPSGNFSKISFASSSVLALTMKTTPFPSVWKYHWSILPARYAFTVSCTSCGMIWARWAGVMGVPMKWEIARIFVVGTGGSGFCAEVAPSGVIGFFMAVPPYLRAALLGPDAPHHGIGDVPGHDDTLLGGKRRDGDEPTDTLKAASPAAPKALGESATK